MHNNCIAITLEFSALNYSLRKKHSSRREERGEKKKGLRLKKGEITKWDGGETSQPTVFLKRNNNGVQKR